MSKAIAITNEAALLDAKTGRELLSFGAPKERLLESSALEENDIYKAFRTTPNGLSEEDVLNRRECFGDNRITPEKADSLAVRIVKAFINPFTSILIILALVSLVTDVFMADEGEANFKTVIIISIMVTLSGLLRFVQERRSSDAAAKLIKMITTTTSVERIESGICELPLDEVVVGDLIHLSAGDMIPGDMRILHAKDLFISQSALTGESLAVEKISAANTCNSLTDNPNLAFMGTNVISGSALGIVLATGDDTLFGSLANKTNAKRDQTAFEKGVNSVSWLLIRFMLIMVPAVLFLNGFTKGNWGEAAMFALSIAIGLTPEMLPMIVTSCLAKGSLVMSKEKTIIKNPDSIQNLGAIDTLCTDKTGTLTLDRVVLEKHLNINGDTDLRVLRHAFLNSYYQTGLKNLMDVAIIEETNKESKDNHTLCELSDSYRKVDEIPFDFNRRRMSVIVSDFNGKTQMITKGAVEEMLNICSYAEYNGKVTELTDSIKHNITHDVSGLNNSGMRVLAIAQKTSLSPTGEYRASDECDMVLMGYLAFLDPPKESAKAAINALTAINVNTKILTGDNNIITGNICSQVGINADNIMLGTDIDRMNDDELYNCTKQVNVFAKLSPDQKARIITVMRNNGNCVGYMGDGINDTPAMKASDVGISVDTAVDIAKETADVILLEKNLMVLEKGIIEGRKTYANMIKYIKMTASSNFGNMLSVLAASIFLPFMPMLSLHLILLNLIYDLTCTAIPWDNVDSEYLTAPRKWNASGIGRFMLFIGPTSSVFDIITYLLMYFVICPMFTGGQLFSELSSPAMKTLFMAVFHTGWFIESMWTQTLVIHMLRTPKIPFIQSHASSRVTALTILGIAVLTSIPFTFAGHAIGLVSLPAIFFIFLLGIVTCYMVLATIAKKLYVSKYGELL